MEKYKLTKSIRFKLNKIDSFNYNDIFNDNLYMNSKQDFNLENFIILLAEFLKDLNKFVYYTNEDNKKFKQNLVVSKSWLKQYAKNEIFGEKLERFNTIKFIQNLKDKIITRINVVNDIFERLRNIKYENFTPIAKRVQIGLLIKELSTKHNLSFLISFVKDAKDKHEMDNLSIELKQVSDKLNDYLRLAQLEYTPSQSSGLTIVKASFNYYTIDKKPIDFEKQIRAEKNKLKISINDLFKYNKFNDIKKDLKNNLTQYEHKKILLGYAPFIDNLDNTVFLRQILKNIKSQQKKEFNELMQREDFTLEKLKLNQNLFLFTNINSEDFNLYFNLTKQIFSKNNKINNSILNESQKRSLKSDLQKLKKERGSLINAANKNYKQHFKNYKLFANFYREIAQTHGRILSKLLEIEKNKIESQLLNYWALILEENRLHKLVLIPKKNVSDFKQFVDYNNNNLINNTNKIKLFWFESFTLRSLRKLCFGYLDNNDFYKNLKSEGVLTKYKDEKGNQITGDFFFKGNELEIIEFYKDILNSNYAKKVLSYPVQQVKEEIINKKFNNLNDFQIALEKICYKRYQFYEDNIFSILEKYSAEIFDITSLDIYNQNLDIINKLSHKNKMHTNIWNTFWDLNNINKGFDVRLNPEISISYRIPKDSRVSKYGANSNNYDKYKHNRYLYPQLTLITTISEHNNSPTINTSFKDSNDLNNILNTFNNKFKKEDIKFALGIDNGETELATLGVYLPDFKKSSSDASIFELNNINKYGFKVLHIKNLEYAEKDKNGRIKKIIQNPSYFVNKEQYMFIFNKNEEEYKDMFSLQFELKTLLTLDLTTAKVINGYVVDNGDVSTYFNLWMRHAQRNIWDLNDHTKDKTAKKVILKNNDELSDDEKVKFIEYLNKGSNHEKLFNNFAYSKRLEFTKWLFSYWDDKEVSLLGVDKELFDKIRNGFKKKNKFSKYIIFAVCYIGENVDSVNNLFDVRNIFKNRADFYFLKSENEIKQEIDNYNKSDTLDEIKKISNDELDLKIGQLKSSIVSNAIGVIDFIYKYYKEKTGGLGLIVKEGFGITDVEESLDKFSGNIYRNLERKLYQKFQNYGLVPPIKNLLELRNKKIENLDKILKFGNICFVSENNTSQCCPVCNKKYDKKHGFEKCSNCMFNPVGIMHTNDGIAAYNIAKRGFVNLQNEGSIIFSSEKNN